MSILQSLRALAFLALLPFGSAVAVKVDPPTIALGRPATSIVVADYREPGLGERVVFDYVRTVRSAVEIPGLIDLAKPDLPAPLVVGKRYLLAYTVMASDKRKRVVTSARGAAFLSSPGLRPAIWEYSTEMEALVAWGIGDEPDAVRAAFPRLVELLKSHDRRISEFAAAELAFRPALLATLSEREQRPLQRFVLRDESALAAAQAELLAASSEMTAAPGALSRWDAVVRRLLRATPVNCLAVPGRSQLVLAAFTYLDGRDAIMDGKVVQRWLESDDVALVEAAASSFRRRSVETASTSIDRALDAGNISATGREFLIKYRRDLANPPARL